MVTSREFERRERSCTRSPPEKSATPGTKTHPNIMVRKAVATIWCARVWLINRPAGMAIKNTTPNGRTGNTLDIAKILGEPPARFDSSAPIAPAKGNVRDRKSTRLNSSHEWISYAVFCLKKKNKRKEQRRRRKIAHMDKKYRRQRHRA